MYIYISIEYIDTYMIFYVLCTVKTCFLCVFCLLHMICIMHGGGFKYFLFSHLPGEDFQFH